MYEYRVFDVVLDQEVFYGREQECRERIYYEWKYGLHSYEEGRFVLQRRPINPRWEDVD